MLKYFFLAMLALGAFVLSPSSGNADPVFHNWSQNPPTIPNNEMNESTWLIHGGQLYIVGFNRDLPPGQLSVQIRDLSNNLVMSVPWTGTMGDVLVDTDGTIYVYGITNPQTYGNSVIVSTLDWNAQTLSAPTTIYTGPPSCMTQNIGVGMGPSGTYVIGMEQDFNNGVNNLAFSSGTSALFPSLTVLGIAPNGIYSRPDIHYNATDGHYYVTASALGAVVHFMKSATLGTGTFEDFVGNYGRGNVWPNGAPFMAPDFQGDPFDANVKITEFNGQTYILYLESDETTYSNDKYLVYPGPLTQFDKELLPN